MVELAERFPTNPILRPVDVCPSRPDFTVACVLNPGAFRFQGKTGLLVRVGERPIQEEGWLSTPLHDSEADSGVRILRIRCGDPDLKRIDSRVFQYRGDTYVTTLSHLRLAWSDDGIHFTVDKTPTLEGRGSLESMGIEDCRVSEIEGRYWLTFSATSLFGYAVGLISTVDWKSFDRHGMIFPTPNKDCAIFPQKIGRYYYALHRPSSPGFGGHFMWTARSTNMFEWGDHRCTATSRRGLWDSARIGAGAAPFRTDKGWLEIYHGADHHDRYCLGLMLLDADDPARVLARSTDPILEPAAVYEREGFFANVVFTNGQIVEGNRVTVYYGAADSVVCAARFPVDRLLQLLSP